MKAIKWTRKQLWFGVLGVASLVVITLFHNCSRVNLKKAEVLLNSTSPTFLSSHICPQAVQNPNDSSKYVFIIDLSASNFGDWVNRNGGFYFDPSLATDPTKTRFAAIRNFINTCGAADPNARYSIIGISNSAGTLTTSNAGTPVLSCLNTSFGSSATALQDLSAWKTVKT